ncbi:MAG TPA: acyltransferase family protein [Burkholderiaceae bacterium]|nr:acyltransferase family protein [Burkholderiaceae bacterium]
MSAVATSAHPRYRPDIDGLRAVAILSVVAFHAFPSLIRGGFVGVDVFFVISGYLISSVILGNLEAGSFSFWVFYQHRIRRIFPALGVMLASCAVAGWYLLPEGAYAELGKHIAGGAGFVANLVLWKEAGYFDSASDTKPLLHLWSLGIEEQFYFVWPLVLWFAWKRRWNLLLVTAGVLLASFCANVVMVRIDAVANFYSPATRVWELLIGALLACKGAIKIKSPGLHAKLANPLAVGGLAAIALAECLLAKDKAFPGWWALLPTLGAAAIIAAGPLAWVNRRLLSNPAMVGIGLISYPLYLWHWPILAFLRITGAFKGALEIGVCAIGAAFVLSWLTYRFVERPFRSQWSSGAGVVAPRAPSAPNRRAAGLLVFMTLAAVLGGVIHQTNGNLHRDRIKIAALPALPDKSVFDRLKIYEHYDQPNTTCRDQLGMSLLPEEVCITNSAAPKVMFFGDSHAMGLYSAIFADHLAVPSVLIASPGCLVYPNLTYRPNGKEWGQDCTEIAKKGLAYANRSPDIGTVVISMVRKGDNPASLTNFYARQTQLTERDVLSAGTDHLIRSLLASGKTVIYVVDVPYFHHTPENCQSKFLVSGADECVFKRAEMNAPFKDYFEVLRKIQRDYPALKILNAEDVLCRKDTCAQHDGAQYFYIDKDHLSVYGSETVLASLFRQFPLN